MYSTVAIIFVASLSLTGLMRLYALKKNLIDAPNKRSSHTIPTPRGGGLSIVFLFLLFIILGFYRQEISASTFLMLFGSGVMVAGIGFLDDHGHVSAKWRLLIHFLAAAWALYWLEVGSNTQQLSSFWLYDVLKSIFIILLTVWSLNLFNFMDGIDGIAAIEGIFVFGGGAFIYWLTKGSLDFESVLMIVLSSATMGFLIWNWPPAKIFMGDGCSGFLGLIIVVFAFLTTQNGGGNYWSWLILYGVFFVDSSVTLLRRIILGEKFYEAHRSHAYQIFSRNWKSHQKVTLWVCGINIFWLLPFAILSALRPALGPPCTLLALLPLVIIVVQIGAGTKNA